MEKNVKINLTPIDIAVAFCDMDGEEQAEFFNHVGLLVRKWPAAFCFQACYIAGAENLNPAGRSIMTDLANGG